MYVIHFFTTCSYILYSFTSDKSVSQKFIFSLRHLIIRATLRQVEITLDKDLFLCDFTIDTKLDTSPKVRSSKKEKFLKKYREREEKGREREK